MTDQLKACKNCRHFRDEGDYYLFCEKYSYETYNYISGETTVNNYHCNIARDEKNLCGKEAVGYEPKPVINKPHRLDEPSSLLDHAKKFLFSNWF